MNNYPEGTTHVTTHAVGIMGLGGYAEGEPVRVASPQDRFAFRQCERMRLVFPTQDRTIVIPAKHLKAIDMIPSASPLAERRITLPAADALVAPVTMSPLTNAITLLRQGKSLTRALVTALMDEGHDVTGLIRSIKPA